MTDAGGMPLQTTVDPANKMDCYVYYRVRADLAVLLRERVATMQNCLQQEFGITGSLKRRSQQQEGKDTWMEVYADIPQDFDTILAQACAFAMLQELIAGERHIEHFLDVTSCA